MKKCVLMAAVLVLLASTGWSLSYFQLELAYNVEHSHALGSTAVPVGQDSQPYDFEVLHSGGDQLRVGLDQGSAMSLFIGSEYSLDFNLKLDVELGFHVGKYGINAYNFNNDNILGNHPPGDFSYFQYMLIAGIRIKGDFQVTTNVSLEPYAMLGITPIYMFSPNSKLRDRMNTDLIVMPGTPSFTFNQDSIWAITTYGFGMDFDFSRSSVEYSGSAKYLIGFSIRWAKQNVEFNNNLAQPVVRYVGLNGTVLF